MASEWMDFDPYEVLQQHERGLNQVIKAHNELAAFSEELLEKIVLLETKCAHNEQEINRLYAYIGEHQ